MCSGHFCRLLGLLFLLNARLFSQDGVGLVRHAPQVSGTVTGSLQLLLPEAVTMNSGAKVSGDLMVPGSPKLQLNGQIQYAGVKYGTGSTSPSNYAITLNSGIALGYIVYRTDAVAMPIVGSPAQATGVDSVTVNSKGQLIQSWTRIKNLTLNSNVGEIPVPAGTYGEFVVNDGSSLAFGTAGSVAIQTYDFQKLTLNGKSAIKILSPVTIRIAGGVTLNGMLGNAANPAWLNLQLSSGGLTLNSGSSFAGYVTAPNGTIVVNSNSLFQGGLISDRLVVNSAGVLQLMAAQSANRSPVAQAASYQVQEDTALPISLEGTDPEGAALSYEVVTLPLHGSLSGAGALRTYKPGTDFNGSDSFTFRVSDGLLWSTTASVALTVSPVNDAPLANSGNVTLSEDASAGIVLTGTDQDGDSLSFEISKGPESGVLSGTPPNLRYTPAPHFHGSDSFSFKISDGKLTSDAAVIALNVVHVNHSPVCEQVLLSTIKETSCGFIPLGADPDGDTLVYSISTPPAHGRLEARGTTWSYVPEAGFHGSDEFRYQAFDGTAYSEEALVKVDVRFTPGKPTASSFHLALREDTPTPILLNGFDADGLPLSFRITKAPQHGSLPGSAASYVYQSSPDYFGEDSFSYVVSNGYNESDNVTVVLDVAPVNDAPCLVPQDLTATAESRTLLVIAATDVDQDVLAFSVGKEPAHGELVQLRVQDNKAEFVYTPTSGFFGSDDFVIQVSDDQTTSEMRYSISVGQSVGEFHVDAGSDASMRVTSATGTRPRGRIVANCDEWALTDPGYEASASAGLFAKNLADYLTGGKRGAKILAYTNIIPGSVDFIYTGANLKATLLAAGYEFTTSSTIEMTSENMKAYDAVFLGASVVDNQELIKYVETGGGVYLSAGTHWSGTGADVEAALWNPFLNHFGLNYAASYNQIGGTLPIRSSSPLFHGISSLLVSNGNSVSCLDVDNPFTYIPFTYANSGIFGVFGNDAGSIFLYGSIAADSPTVKSSVSVRWEQVSGPALARFDSFNSLVARVWIDVSGIYVFKLVGTSVSTESSDLVVITASAPPVVDAGPDLILRSPNAVLPIVGTCADDGIPRRATMLWRQLQGPGNATLSGADTMTPTAAFPTPGRYVFEFSAFDGVDSSTDVMSVLYDAFPKSTCPESLVAWFPFEHSLIDIINGIALKRSTECSFGLGKVTESVLLKDGNELVAKKANSLDLRGFDKGFTVEAWVAPSVLLDTPLFLWSENGREVFSLREWNSQRALAAFQSGESSANWNISSEQVFVTGEWTHVAVTYDRAKKAVVLYANGIEVGTGFMPDFDPRKGDVDFTVGRNLDGSRYFVGSIDELSIYREPLSAAQIHAIWKDGALGKSRAFPVRGPIIDAGPDLSSKAGKPLHIEGHATDTEGPAPLAFKWTVLSGAAGVAFSDTSSAATDATFSEVGIYVLQLEANNGQTSVSDAVTVRVSTQYPDALGIKADAWWQMNGTFTDAVTGLGAIQSHNGLSFSQGACGQGLLFDGIKKYGLVDQSLVPALGASADGFSIEFWYKPTSLRDSYLLEWADRVTSRVGLNLRETNSGQGLGISVVRADGQTPQYMATDGIFTAGDWVHLGITYARATGMLRLYKNGHIVLENVVGSFDWLTSGDLYLGSHLGESQFAEGIMDELSLYGRCLPPEQIMTIASSISLGKRPLNAGKAPSLNAGISYSVRDTATLVQFTASATDDDGPSLLETKWEKLSGPGDVEFSDPLSLASTARFSQTGVYLIRLSAWDGLNLSTDVAEVRVGTCYAPTRTANQVGWWSFNETPLNSVSKAQPVQFVNALQYTAGKVAEGVAFDGKSAHGHILQDSCLDIGKSASGFTAEFWYRPTVLVDASLALWSTTPSSTQGYGLNIQEWNSGTQLRVVLYKPDGTYLGDFATPTAFSTKEWVHLAISYDRPKGLLRLFVNGVSQTEVFIGDQELRTLGDLYLGAYPDGSRSANGTMDEFSLYDRALNSEEIWSIFKSGSLGKAPVDRGSIPQVSVGQSSISCLVSTRIALSGVATDSDGPSPLLIHWVKEDGPGQAVFETPDSVSTSVVFDQPGLYVLRLDACDGLNIASDRMEVRVDVVGATIQPANLRAWWPLNGSPFDRVSGAHPVVLANGLSYEHGLVSEALSFSGNMATGYVSGGPWSDVGQSSKGFSVEFWYKPNVLRDCLLLHWADSSSSGYGLEVREWDGGRQLAVELRSVDGSFIGELKSDVVFVEGVWIHIGIAYDRSTGQIDAFINGQRAASLNLGDRPLKTTGDLYFGSLGGTNRFCSGLMDEVSLYDIPLTSVEMASIFGARAAGKAPIPANKAPTVSVQAVDTVCINEAVPLIAQVADDGIPNPPSSITTEWSKVSGPGIVAFANPEKTNTSATFAVPGDYVLRLQASDSALSSSFDLRIHVASAKNKPPVARMVEPLANARLPENTPFYITVKASDPDGTISKVEFYNGTQLLGIQTRPDATDASSYYWLLNEGLSSGNYSLSAKIYDNSNDFTITSGIAITVEANSGPASVVQLDYGLESKAVTAPISVDGLVYSQWMTDWRLEARLKPAEPDSTTPWATIATGLTQVGTPQTDTAAASFGHLGTFDPSNLLNGIYELRLIAHETTGAEISCHPNLTLQVAGNMKVGAFTLAFEDLRIPSAGIPISITRCYDSRDTGMGDFGPGWKMAIANIRLQKSSNLGQTWWQTPQTGNGLQFYQVLPIQDRLISIVMPDGETHRFRTGAYVKLRDGDPDYASFGMVVSKATIRFYPVGDTSSSLVPVDQNGAEASTVWINGTGDQDLMDSDDAFSANVWNPRRFMLTTKEGSRFILDEKLGLLALQDLQGNTLSLHRDSANRVDTIASVQHADSGDLTRSVQLHRDDQERIDYIKDQDGHQLDYLYDDQGRLKSFSNRELETTQFLYENTKFPLYLTKIIDPRGTPAIRSEFDENGRMVKQFDADGNQIALVRGTDSLGRFEKVTDRLGNPTTYWYDERGNITRKEDALGAASTFDYYPDSEHVKFEEDHLGNIRSFAYDARGNVTVETTGASRGDDPAAPSTGFSTRTEYNEYSAPTKITDPAGRTQTFSYYPGTANLHVHTVGAGSSEEASTTYAYYGDGTLKEVVDALSGKTAYSYNYSFSDKDWPGAVKETSITTTGAGKELLRKSRMLFDAQDNLLADIATRTLPDGSTEEVVTRHVFDLENRELATLFPDGRVSETRYTSFGKPEKVVQWKNAGDYKLGVLSAGRVTTYGYDDRGNQTSIAYPDGNKELVHFDAENRRDWTQNRRGYRTFFEYDADGRLLTTIEPDENDGTGEAAPTASGDKRLADNARSRTVYDLIGRVQYQIDPLGVKTESTYEDHTGAPLRRSKTILHHAKGNLVTSYEYDKAGNVRFVTDPRNNIVETQYDGQGHATKILFPATDEHPSTNSRTVYDLLGRRTALIDQEGRITRYRYDGLGRLCEVRQYLDSSVALADDDFALASTHAKILSTRYSYDELGRQLTQTDALGRVTSYESDALGRRTLRRLPKDAGEAAAPEETLRYDDWGQLWKRKDFAGRTTIFDYDSMGRLVSKTADAAHPSLAYSHAIAKVEFGYDEQGGRTSSTTYAADGRILYLDSTPRDAVGRLKSKTAQGTLLDYQYYANGLLKDVVSSTNQGVNVGYRYDDLNRLSYVDDLGGGLEASQTTGYGYNANGSVETISYSNGIQHVYGYDSLNRLRTLTVGTLAAGIHSYEYKLKPTGHREHVIEAGKTTVYSYDELYRLTGETVSGGNAQAPDRLISYDLDKVGNRLNRWSNLAAVAQQVGRSYNSRDWLDSDNYDLNGNTISGQLCPATAGAAAENSGADIYDFENRLIVRRKADGSTLNIAYDADGNRIGKSFFDSAGTLLRATSYLVDANNLTGYAQVLEETLVELASTTLVIYTFGSDLIRQVRINPSRYSQPQNRYYLHDGGGSVRELTDDSGVVTDLYEYDAFGILVTRTGSTENAYLYRGEQWDQDLGLYYNRARYLNTDSGRFWTQDGYEGVSWDPATLHKYTYAGVNPVFYTDPTGNYSLVELGAVVSVMGTIALIAIPAANRLVAGAVGWLADNPDGTKRYSISSLGVYDESVALMGDLGMTPMDFQENLLQGAMTQLGQDAASSAVMGGAFKGVSSGIAAFRRGKVAAESRALQFVKCFPPGTLVLMADGSTKPIEEIKEGDEVLAKDPASTDAPRSFKVAAQLQNSTEHLVTVEVQDAAGRVAHFKATREHPFWVKGLGWKNAVDLTDKDILADNSGSDVRVLSVKTEAEKSPTFNLTIDSKHTFYVVDNGVSVLVHNTGEELTTLYRGVWDTHPAFNQALLGNAAPRGGNIVSPYLHNMGNTNSIFTSWTTDAAVAAERAGAGGVILEGRFPASRLVASPNVAPSLIPEAEVLVLGKVTGAKVIPVGICP